VFLIDLRIDVPPSNTKMAGQTLWIRPARARRVAVAT
jgi:hypothetical protein